MPSRPGARSGSGGGDGGPTPVSFVRRIAALPAASDAALRTIYILPDGTSHWLEKRAAPIADSTPLPGWQRFTAAVGDANGMAAYRGEYDQPFSFRAAAANADFAYIRSQRRFYRAEIVAGNPLNPAAHIEVRPATAAEFPAAGWAYIGDFASEAQASAAVVVGRNLAYYGGHVYYSAAITSAPDLSHYEYHWHRFATVEDLLDAAGDAGIGLTEHQRAELDELTADGDGRAFLGALNRTVGMVTQGARVNGLRISLLAEGEGGDPDDVAEAYDDIGTANEYVTPTAQSHGYVVVATETANLLDGTAEDWSVRLVSGGVTTWLHRDDFVQIRSGALVVFRSIAAYTPGLGGNYRVYRTTLGDTEFSLADGYTFDTGASDTGTGGGITEDTLYARTHVLTQNVIQAGIAASVTFPEGTDSLDDFNEIIVVGEVITGSTPPRQYFDSRVIPQLAIRDAGAPLPITFAGRAQNEGRAADTIDRWAIDLDRNGNVQIGVSELEANEQGWLTIIGRRWGAAGGATAGTDAQSRLWDQALAQAAGRVQRTLTFDDANSDLEAADSEDLLSARDLYTEVDVGAQEFAAWAVAGPAIGDVVQLVLFPNPDAVGSLQLKTVLASDQVTALDGFLVDETAQRAGGVISIIATQAYEQVAFTSEANNGAHKVAAVRVAGQVTGGIAAVTPDNRTIAGAGTAASPLKLANLYALPVWTAALESAQGDLTRVSNTVYIKFTAGAGTTNDPGTEAGRAEWAVFAKVEPLSLEITDDGYRNLGDPHVYQFALAAGSAMGAFTIERIWDEIPDAATHLNVTFSVAGSAAAGTYIYALRYRTDGNGQTTLRDEDGTTYYIGAGGSITGRVALEDILAAGFRSGVFMQAGVPVGVEDMVATVSIQAQHRVVTTERTEQLYNPGDTIADAELTMHRVSAPLGDVTWNLLRWSRAVRWGEIDNVWVEFTVSNGATGRRWIEFEGLAWSRMQRVAAEGDLDIPVGALGNTVPGAIFGGVSDEDEVTQVVPKLGASVYHAGNSLAQGCHVFIIVPEEAEANSDYCVGARVAIYAPTDSARRPAIWSMDVRRIEGGR